MSLAKYNGNCKDCGRPIRKGVSQVRVRTDKKGRQTVCAHHMAFEMAWDDTSEPCDARRDAMGTGDYSLLDGLPY